MRMWMLMLMLDVEVEVVKSKYWCSTRLGRSCQAKLAIGGESGSGSGARVLLSYASGLTRVHKYQKSVELPEQISLLLLLLCSCSLLDSSITAPLRSAPLRSPPTASPDGFETSHQRPAGQSAARPLAGRRRIRVHPHPQSSHTRP